MRPVLVIALAVALGAVASSSRADVQTARQLFADGVKRFQKGDYEGARRLFEDADREHHSPVIDYNLALTEERLGHYQAAVEAYERYLSQAGEEGEFAQPAAIAVAQIKARAGRINVRSEPGGARIFINGWPVRERTPTSVLVPPGHHLVAIEGDGFRHTADVDLDSGQSREVSIVRPITAEPSPFKSGDMTGFVWGGSFQVVPYGYFARTSSSASGQGGATGILVGLSFEAGFAFTRRSVFGLRAYGSIGSECRQVFDSHIASVGPMLTIRIYENVWIGAGLYGGNGETCRDVVINDGLPNPKRVKYSTDIVFSPVFDVSYAVTSQKYGQWLVSAGLGYYFATPSNDNRLVYAPIGFGPRFFSSAGER